MALRTLHIYQDESGSLADADNRVVIIALVTTLDPWSLRFIVKKVHKKFLAQKGKRYKERGLKEFKYATTFRKEREKILNILKNKDVEIFALNIKKGDKKIADSPLNYGLALSEILEALLRHYQDNDFEFELVLDRHYTQKRQLEKLEKVMEKNLNTSLKPIHADSKANPFIALTDFVAGVLREEFDKGDNALSSIISEKVIFKEEILWQDLKKKWLDKTKQR